MHNYLTVLIADEHHETAEALAAAFLRRGFVTLTASTGVETQQLAADVYPALIIMDVSLPAGNGLQVLSTLRRDRVLRSIPVFIYTAVESLAHPDMKLQGVSYYFVKGQAQPSEIVAAAVALLSGGSIDAALMDAAGAD